MLFNSFQFIFLFLPPVILIYLLLSKSRDAFLQMVWISTMSFVFYAYWNKIYLILLLGSVCVNFTFGQYLITHKRKSILILGILFNITVLAYFKYFGFILKNFSFVTGYKLTFTEIALPLGISFITFQKITYLIGTYRGTIKENNFLRFLVFISFFPQLIAGPIVHYNQIMPQFKQTRPKILNTLHFNMGLTFFVIGLAKKIILADTAALYSDPLFYAVQSGYKPTFQESWMGVFAYSFQIYFDFSGYSDMAIGLAHMFGIKLPLNFNSPYQSRNIIDFWRRWHMTLSFFLRDYVYIPLGGNRQGKYRKQINIMLTMLLGGLWHGASWTFVIWGGLHGLMLIINHLWIDVKKRIGFSGTHNQQWFYKTFIIGLTFLCVSMAWVFFRAPTFRVARRIFSSLFGLYGFGIPENSYLYSTPAMQISNVFFQSGQQLIGLSISLYLLFMFTLIFFFPNSQEIVRRMKKPNLHLQLLRWRPGILHFAGINILFIVCLAMLYSFEIKPFEYFAF